MLALAWEGITSLSIQPIRMITGLGTIVFAISIIMIIYSLVSYFMGFAVSGWASILCSIWAIGGLQILAIGIIGEYIGKFIWKSKGARDLLLRNFLRTDKAYTIICNDLKMPFVILRRAFNER